MLDLKPQAAGFKVVISGHSHVPKQEVRDGVLYFNPGSAGPRRFKLPITVGRLVCEGEGVRAEIDSGLPIDIGGSHYERETLGWNPTPYSLRSGRTIASAPRCSLLKSRRVHRFSGKQVPAAGGWGGWRLRMRDRHSCVHAGRNGGVGEGRAAGHS